MKMCGLIAWALLTCIPAIHGEEKTTPTAVPPVNTLTEAPRGFDAPREGSVRGKVDEVEYDSKSVGIRRKMMVYTPPGFSRESSYPVLYLLHGIGDTEKGWLRTGNADVILDNLL